MEFLKKLKQPQTFIYQTPWYGHIERQNKKGERNGDVGGGIQGYVDEITIRFKILI